MRLRKTAERILASVRKSARIAALGTTLCAVTLSSVEGGQVSEVRFGQFGPVGQSLSERELTQIADLTSAAGKPAWLLLGFRSMIPGVTSLTVYLQPDVRTERLRRGRILRLVAENPPDLSERSDWRVKGTGNLRLRPSCSANR